MIRTAEHVIPGLSKSIVYEDDLVLRMRLARKRRQQSRQASRFVSRRHDDRNRRQRFVRRTRIHAAGTVEALPQQQPVRYLHDERRAEHKKPDHKHRRRLT